MRKTSFLDYRIVDINDFHAENLKPAEPITKNIEGLKGDEALKVVMDAWEQAVRTRAPELKIVVGLSKPGTQIRRKIVKCLVEK